jgi:hypothetical protein
MAEYGTSPRASAHQHRRLTMDGDMPGHTEYAMHPTHTTTTNNTTFQAPGWAGLQED